MNQEAPLPSVTEKIAPLSPYAATKVLSPYAVSPVRIPSRTYLMTKRAIDVAVSSFVLIAASPLYLLIIVLIKIHSPGPAIFKQKRAGHKGKDFTIYKFRTMHITALKYQKSPKSKDDPRINAAGRLLRQTSLDELPQFFNILKGDMSLVGPRPEMPFIVATYEPHMMKRLEAKPGLTGLWQISGRKNRALDENPEYDLEYVDNRSLMLDMKIILKTVPAVILRKGAY